MSPFSEAPAVFSVARGVAGFAYSLSCLLFYSLLFLATFQHSVLNADPRPIDLEEGAFAESRANPNFVSYPEPSLIRRDLSGFKRVVRRNYDKFIAYRTPNGGTIPLLATDGFSDEQLLRAYNILDYFLTDAPGAKYGADKSAVADAMAENGARMVLPGGSDGKSPIPEDALVGQPLYALEFPVEGSVPYITNDYRRRDAGFEEIFHLVHDYGIGTKYTDGALKDSFQPEVAAATAAALESGRWGIGGRDVRGWLAELRAEGSLQQEYLAAVLDSYFGYWAGWKDGPGGMWGVYVAKTREDVCRLDPGGAALIDRFLSGTVTYMARIDPAFTGSFKMHFDASAPYTHKSRYLVNARLTGDLPSGLSANDHDNVLIGNAGDNTIDGMGGADVVQYDLNASEATIARTATGLRVEGPGIGTDTLRNIEILRFRDRDIATDAW